jgi:hypothetical protein
MVFNALALIQVEKLKRGFHMQHGDFLNLFPLLQKGKYANNNCKMKLCFLNVHVHECYIYYINSVSLSIPQGII